MKKQSMKKLSIERGFSLIEVMIAMVVLLIFMVSFTALYSESFVAIFSSGKKSEAQYDLQEQGDRILGDLSYDSTMIQMEVLYEDPNYFTVRFADINGGDDIELQGKEIVLNKDYQDAKNRDRSTNITVFIPGPNNSGP